MRSAIRKNLYSSYYTGSNRVEVNLLQFADDTIFFGEASLSNVITIKAILRCFELVSGLKVNFHKSRCGAIGTDQNVLVRFATLLNCKIMDMPFNYLGLPIGANPRKLATWNPVKKKLARWKNKFLSLAGRACLINSVLSSLPLFYLSFFRIPKKVHLQLVRLQWNFLWGHMRDHKKVAWISWDRVCRSKNQGGLGIKDIILFNESLLGKWRWNLFHDSNSLWVKLLESKYGGWRNLVEGEDKRSHSYWWKDLRRVCGSNNEQQWFDNMMTWKLMDGERIKFWEDKWLGNISLANKFPRLYVNSLQNHWTIKNMGTWSGTLWIWDLKWRRRWLRRDDTQLQELESLLREVSLDNMHQDFWVWDPGQDEKYTVNSAYKEKLSWKYGRDEIPVLKQLWKLKIPPKAATLIWRLYQKGMPTVDNLTKRNIGVSFEDQLCRFCKGTQETSHHLFFVCNTIDTLWKACYGWANLSTVLPSNTEQHFMQLPCSISFGKVAKGWKILWCAVVYNIWLVRNNIIFRQERLDIEHLQQKIKYTTWSWLKMDKAFTFSYAQWEADPGTCLTSFG
uniref:Ribonuclease H protein At1g65750 family n=1 Tax=Cajanus cajan TaxID=3821 RepID=A0A151S011_CAJCA|nr:Putative ribonuclease H protein At1g65750 family [Cajanus cajan]